MGVILAVLAALEGLLERLRLVLGRLEGILDRLGGILGRLGGVLEASWGLLEVWSSSRWWHGGGHAEGSYPPRQALCLRMAYRVPYPNKTLNPVSFLNILLISGKFLKDPNRRPLRPHPRATRVHTCCTGVHTYKLPKRTPRRFQDAFTFSLFI